ncbi:hypothetical protein JB92DRAFT_2121300 [Gautieria morchelliformis]|nr:hypothetical protein JB92DRAFT_2121300 [Gautieria morchelliformis]
MFAEFQSPVEHPRYLLAVSSPSTSTTMIRLSLIRPFLILTSVVLPLATAQTVTVADPNIPGGSIVEVVSTNANGLQVTRTANSIPAGGAVQTTTNPLVATTPTPLVPTAVSTSSSSSSSTRVATTAAAPVITQGPVAQPAPTVPVGQGVTQYTYTTVNALGETVTLSDIFTPTYNTLSPPSSPAVGTVLGMSAWSALIGTNTAGGPTNGAERWQLTRYGAGGLLVLACGIVMGALAVL